jgi:hypothetical protein
LPSKRKRRGGAPNQICTLLSTACIVNKFGHQTNKVI